MLMKSNSKNQQKVIETILVKLVKEFSPKKVILFGSHAEGKPGPDSDIDLLIIKDTTDRFLDRWVKVKHILNGTHNSQPVEALILTPDEIANRLSRGDQFVQEILEKGIVLYEG